MNQEKNNYESSQLLLEYIHKEYQYNLDEFNNLNTRIGIIVALVGLYISILIPQLFKCSIFDSSNNLVFDFISIMFLFTSIVLSVVSLLFFIGIFSMGNYSNLDINNLFSEDAANTNKNSSAYFLMLNYKRLINSNKIEFKKITHYYQLGLKFLTASIILFGFYILTTYAMKFI